MKHVKLFSFITLLGFGFMGVSAQAEGLSGDIHKLTNDQGVKATVLTGGLAGGIVEENIPDDKEGANELVVKDIDLGEVKIGDNLEDLIKKKMVTVRDWSGGDGWHLTAKHKDSNRNSSLQLGVQVDKDTPTQLNNEEAPVTEGESLLSPTVKDGKYLSQWGTHPKTGDFNNVIEWNLSHKVAKSE